MKYILLVSVFLLVNFAGFAQEEQEAPVPFEISEKLDELASLPEGLTVSHTPDPVLYTANTPSLSGVQWQHSTTVSSVSGPVSIVEFGYFIQRDGKWGFPYGVEIPYFYDFHDFAEFFNCPNSRLLPGQSYTYAENQSVKDCVPEQVVMWYFIGTDSKGNRVKGEANLKLLGEYDPSQNGPQR